MPSCYPPSRHVFEWRRPRLIRYRAAERSWFRVALNRYAGVVSGVAVQAGQTVWSLTWGAPVRVDR